jgi:hypothetical protein
MQIIFVFATNTTNVVSRRSIKLALKTFLASPHPSNITTSIKEHLQRPGLFGRDAALQKITELIESNSYRISPEQMSGFKNQLRNVDVEHDDDSW